VSRPGRSNEDLTSRLAGDKRVKALRVLAQRPNLPAEVYEYIGKIGSKTLDETLAGNPWTPRALRIAKLLGFTDSSRHSEYRLQHQLAELTADDESLLGEIADRTENLIAMKMFLDAGVVSGKTLLRYCDRALRPVPLPADRRYSIDSTRDEVLLLLARQPLDARRRQRLAKEARRVAEEYTHWSYMRTKFVEAAELLESFDEGFHARLGEFAATSDPEVATKLLEELLMGKPSEAFKERILREMCSHRTLPSPVTLAHVNGIGWEFAEMLEKEYLRRRDFEALGTCVRSDYRKPVWFSELNSGEQRSLVVEVIKACRRHDDEVPRWALSVEGVEDFVDIVVEALPWPQLCTRLAEAGTVLVEVQRRIVAKSEDCPQFWENFETLADEFEGSLSELMDAAANL
jgi:hypothetical protein